MRGTVSKMRAERNQSSSTLNYFLPLGEILLPMNQYLGKAIEIKASAGIACIACGRASSKSLAKVIVTPVLPSWRLAICAL